MSGIFAYLGNSISASRIEVACTNTRNRGSDDNIIKTISNNLTFGFHRRSIVDTNFKGKPLYYPNKPYVVVYNGELRNCKALIEEHILDTHSNNDCEVILCLYEKYGIAKTIELIDSGAFAFCIYDGIENKLIVTRDRFGVRPLFVSNRLNGELVIASEAKSIVNIIDDDDSNEHLPPGDSLEQFPPGTWSSYDVNTFEQIETYRYYDCKYTTTNITDTAEICSNINELLTKSVRKRIMSERPIGCLLSGGLDSSLISALVAKEFRETGKGTLETFSIGMKGSTDLMYAKKVADHIGSKHHTIELTENDFLAAIPEVIFHIESYDTTTVRASVGNYLVGKYIKENTDITVVFNGDGSDEQSGYLYMGNAPNELEFTRECERLLSEIHFFDVLRSDRSLSSNWSLETRAPFLDTDFVNYYMSVNPRLKMYPTGSGIIEKHLLRSSFDNNDLLPHDVLWRKKEAFSDGCSSNERSWHKIIQEHVDNIVTDDAFNSNKHMYDHNPPELKETFYYRTLFEQYYDDRADIIPHYWLPKWCGTIVDPSARELEVYKEDI